MTPLKALEDIQAEIFDIGYVNEVCLRDRLPIRENILASKTRKEEIDEPQSLVC